MITQLIIALDFECVHRKQSGEKKKLTLWTDTVKFALIFPLTCHPCNTGILA